MICGRSVSEIGQNIGAARDTGCRSEPASIERRQRLAAQDEAGWLVLELQDDTPGLGDFVGIAGAQSDQAGHCAQTGELLHRLVRRAILTDAD